MMLCYVYSIKIRIISNSIYIHKCQHTLSLRLKYIHFYIENLGLKKSFQCFISVYAF